MSVPATSKPEEKHYVLNVVKPEGAPKRTLYLTFFHSGTPGHFLATALESSIDSTTIGTLAKGFPKSGSDITGTKPQADLWPGIYTLTIRVEQPRELGPEKKHTLEQTKLEAYLETPKPDGKRVHFQQEQIYKEE